MGGRVNLHPEFLSTLYITLQNTDYVPTLSFYSHLVCLVLSFLTCKTERKLLPCSFSLRDKRGNEWESPLWTKVPQRTSWTEGPLTTRWQSGGMEFVNYSLNQVNFALPHSSTSICFFPTFINPPFWCYFLSFQDLQWYFEVILLWAVKGRIFSKMFAIVYPHSAGTLLAHLPWLLKRQVKPVCLPYKLRANTTKLSPYVHVALGIFWSSDNKNSPEGLSVKVKNSLLPST